MKSNCHDVQPTEMISMHTHTAHILLYNLYVYIMLNLTQCTFGEKTCLKNSNQHEAKKIIPKSEIHPLTHSLLAVWRGCSVTPTLKNQPYSSRGQFATLGNKTALACHFDKSPVLEYQVLARNVKQIPSGELHCAVPLFNHTLWQCRIKVQHCKSAFFYDYSCLG